MFRTSCSIHNSFRFDVRREAERKKAIVLEISPNLEEYYHKEDNVLLTTNLSNQLDYITEIQL